MQCPSIVQCDELLMAAACHAVREQARPQWIEKGKYDYAKHRWPSIEGDDWGWVGRGGGGSGRLLGLFSPQYVDVNTLTIIIM